MYSSTRVLFLVPLLIEWSSVATAFGDVSAALLTLCSFETGLLNEIRVIFSRDFAHDSGNKRKSWRTVCLSPSNAADGVQLHQCQRHLLVSGK